MAIRCVINKVSLCLVAIVMAGVFASCQSTARPCPDGTASPLEKGVLRVGVTPTGPPMIFLGDGEYMGLDAELAHDLAKTLGLKLEFVEVKWEDQIPALLAGRTDIVMSGMSITRTRLEQVRFSDPYLRAGQMPLVRKDDTTKYESFADVALTSGKVGVDKDTTGDDLVRRRFPYCERVVFPSLDKATEALIKGDVDMVVHDAPSVWWMALVKERDGLAPLHMNLTLEFLGWAMRPDDDELLEKVNGFLADYKANGKLDDAIGRWTPPWDEKKY